MNKLKLGLAAFGLTLLFAAQSFSQTGGAGGAAGAGAGSAGARPGAGADIDRTQGGGYGSAPVGKSGAVTNQHRFNQRQDGPTQRSKSRTLKRGNTVNGTTDGTMNGNDTPPQSP
jgi:hypothetical protein